ncbi:terminase TerL endonuclease subunit [Listeria booriae]|uniref:terminase TerL endonuclease subunit n=1 Tax=Listeria booriae TaxID=1552123 RepID=UPI00162A3158|nr:terminase TerL endonuclease subunit [Listeria booriae]MBC2106140.1 terminase large subunit [Listeria booriae]
MTIKTRATDYPKNVYKYHSSISEWMYLVESKEFPACKEQLELMEYIRIKLEEPDIVFDIEAIDKVIERSERYFFELLPFQRFFVAFVVGVFKGDATLLFDEFLFLAGRGTGKNGLLSTILFNLPDVTNVLKYNIDIVATTEKQAQTSFEDVFDVIDASTKLQKHYKHGKKLITHKRTKSKIEYHTSNARSKDGLRSGAVVFDEIHEFENDDLINVFTSGLGKKDMPRIFYLTTDGFVRGGALDALKSTSKQILSNDSMTEQLLFPYIFKLDNAEEVHDKNMWVKAIPRIAYDKVLLRQVTKEYNKAIDSTGKMIEFLTKRMNIPTQDALSVVAEWEIIEQTNQLIPDLTGYECVGGFDYASMRDFVGVGLLFRNGEKRYWIHHSFICKKSLMLTKFKFDIKRAVHEGYAEVVDADIIDPEYVAQWFIEQSKKYRITNIAGDMYRVNSMKDTFNKYGLPMQITRSGPITHAKISPLVDSLFAMRNIVFGEDFMMRWYTNNVYVKFDPKGNRSYEKIEEKTRKTDGFMAFIHALVIEPDYKPKPTYHRNLKTRTY